MTLTKPEREYIATLLEGRANAILSFTEQCGETFDEYMEVKWLQSLACKLKGKRKYVRKQK